MGLVGTLDTMALADLLQWVCTSRKAGLITVTQGKTQVQLAVGGARVLGAYSNDPPMLLGQFLLSRGKIDEETLHDALARQDTTREHLGKVLTELGAITAEELGRYVVLKAEETIFGMLEWAEAMFEFDLNAESDTRMVRMDHGVDDLIMRGAQRRDEMAQMRTVLGDPGVVLCSTEIELPKSVRESPMASRIYDAIDGHRTMKDILLHSRTSEYFATKFLYELHNAGVVRIKNIKDVKETQPDRGSPLLILEAANTLLKGRQFDGAVTLLAASSQVFPENTEMQQMLSKAEATFLENAYQDRLSRDCIPQLLVPIEVANARDDLHPNERFILDLVHKKNWSVKALTRIAPLHEVDVVRATLALWSKGIVDITRSEEPAQQQTDQPLDEELLRDLQAIDQGAAGEPAVPVALADVVAGGDDRTSGDAG